MLMDCLAICEKRGSTGEAARRRLPAGGGSEASEMSLGSCKARQIHLLDAALARVVGAIAERHGASVLLVAGIF